MQALNPWSSKEIKYSRVFEEFGLKPFPEKWKKELAHYLVERMVIAHRDFGKIMQCIKEGKPFINMTGIASSGGLHFGHKVVIDMFLLFKSFGAKNYLCIADIEGYTSRPQIKTMEQAKEIAANNLAHVLAFGLSKKDVYVQSNYKARYYAFTFEISKKITRNMFEATYGHVDLGKVSAALLQYADILHAQLSEFEGKMPSITPIGLDQDPHARLTRDVVKRLPYDLEMPSFIYFRHQSGLLEGSKMSSSEPASAIFLDDSAEQIRQKVSNAFTGGRETASLQRKLGGKPEICKVCEILRFHYPDSAEVTRIMEECRKGKRLCGETKQFTIEFLTKFLKKHQKKARKKEKLARKMVFGR
jgi:tryptophanyl-tRNA synthetase